MQKQHIRSMTNVPDEQTKQKVAAYIAELTAELEHMAKAQEIELLGKILALASEEARRAAIEG